MFPIKTASVKSSRTVSAVEWLAIILLIIMFAAAIWLTVFFGIRNDMDTALNSVIYLASLLFGTVLFIGCSIVRNDDRKNKHRFQWLIVLSFLSAFAAMSANLFNGRTTGITALTMQIIANSLLGAYWIVFWFYQNRSYPQNELGTLVNAVVIVYMSIYIIFSVCNFFLPIFFAVTSGGVLISRTDYFSVTYMCVWYGFYLLYVFTRKCDQRTKLTLSSYVALPLLLNIITYIFGNDPLFRSIYYSLNSVCFLLPLYFIYFNLHIEHSRRLYQQREELTQARINLMVSQIQPHFIYNSLTAIIGLIDIDPEKAKDSIVSFSDYLRVNLNALKEVRLIPFSKELEHCKTYLEFELLRFRNISVIYDIEAENFDLPALTVQPLLENAVKHGVSKTGVGGTVTLSTKDDGESIRITVSDNGVGFDENAIAPGTHIGLENVRKRLSDLCGGSLRIRSEINVGTEVTVIIPKEGAK